MKKQNGTKASNGLEAMKAQAQEKRWEALRLYYSGKESSVQEAAKRVKTNKTDVFLLKKSLKPADVALLKEGKLPSQATKGDAKSSESKSIEERLQAIVDRRVEAALAALESA